MLLLLLACADEPPAPAALPPLPAVGAPGAPGCRPLELERPGTIEACYDAAGLASLVWTVDPGEGGGVVSELATANHVSFEPGVGANWEAPGLVLAVSREGERVRYELSRKGS